MNTFLNVRSFFFFIAFFLPIPLNCVEDRTRLFNLLLYDEDFMATGSLFLTLNVEVFRHILFRLIVPKMSYTVLVMYVCCLYSVFLL